MRMFDVHHARRRATIHERVQPEVSHRCVDLTAEGILTMSVIDEGDLHSNSQRCWGHYQLAELASFLQRFRSASTHSNTEQLM